MRTTSKGYIFKGKYLDSNTGIDEFRDIRFKGDDKVKVSLQLGLGNNTKLLKPFKFTQKDGAKELSLENIDKFLKSNKKSYFLLKDTFCIFNLNGVLDIKNNKWDNVKIDLYAPKSVSTNGVDAEVCCDKIALSGKLNTFIISEATLNGYKDVILSLLESVNVTDKRDFYLSRIEG